MNLFVGQSPVPFVIDDDRHLPFQGPGIGLWVVTGATDSSDCPFGYIEATPDGPLV